MAAPVLAGLVDTKIVGKLENFDGTDASWPDWSFKAAAWFALLPRPTGTTNVNIDTYLDLAVNHPTDLRRSDLGNTADAVSVTLYHLLVQLCQGRAFGIVRSVEKGNGFQVWRRLHQEYAPTTGLRLSSMLSGLLNPDWTTDTAGVTF